MAAAALAAATAFSPSCRCSQRRPTIRFSSPLSALDSKNSNPRLHRSIPHLGLGSDPSWSGLKYFGVSSLRRFDQKKRKGQCRGRVVYASLFGVGAPEALVIGVVALLVFGPKGLAEVARNLGKTLRAFQPTIRELQDVSREFKSTLEREIGLDEVVSSTSNTYKSTSFANEKQEAVVDPNGRPTTKAYTSDELLKITEDQLTASSIKPQTETSTPKAGPEEASATSEDVSASASGIAASPETAAQRPSSTERPENER